MKYLSRAIVAAFFVSSLIACKPRKENKEQEINPTLQIYRASVTQVNDLVHTRLEIEPDFGKKELRGKAKLTLKPHFHPVDSLILDAKYMRIEHVRMVKWRQNYGVPQFDTVDLSYSYDSLRLKIRLDKRYARETYYTIEIDYVAQPEKVKKSGSEAISESKGLYFINSEGKVPGKPVQVWTQGETEAASCWFPTIDAPNQKTSEEILVTVPATYKTISNGRLESSRPMPGNKRQDHWKQDLPHAPYLFALVIGDFAEVKDKWKGKEVNYYVEHAYEPYARMIFGNTPAMIEFYSNVLQVPYPWDKYHQVVVRDFVSGAMENTGCVVHFDKLQHNGREHLDDTYEDIIAHELFHHWFGDLVTCESWSNLPLNESFATYGEYLWNEHQYGRDEADLKLKDFHQAYKDESEYKSEDLVRYYYEDKEDMFDAHSYQKGGSILHMLRKYVGDEAFFASLKLYLQKHAYKTVEASDLRKAFEEISGEDLNWFFNQWFLGSGHPSLKIHHQTYNGSGEMYGITVVQSGKPYKLPVDIDIYTQKGVERHRIIVEKDSQTFGIPCPNKPLCVIFDAENQLLAVQEETKTIEGWESQMKYAPLSAQKVMALKQLLNVQQDKQKKMDYCRDLLNDSFWNNRAAALRELYRAGFNKEELKPVLETVKEIAASDPKAAVRKETVDIFRVMKDSKQLQNMLDDSSYAVAKKALSSLMNIDKPAAFAFADEHRDEPSATFQEAIFIAIGRSSSKDELEFFVKKIESGNEETARNSGLGLFYYIEYNHPEQAGQVIDRLTALAGNKAAPDVSRNALTALNMIRTYYYYQLYYYRIFSTDKKSRKLYKTKIQEAEKTYDRLEKFLKDYKEYE